MECYKFPSIPHVRRHYPSGYKSYGRYRDWLRDEFAFRCVYCLHREQWCNRGLFFEIDHFLPVSIDPDGELEYTNLVYACAACNRAKSNLTGLPDPCRESFGECLRLKNDGSFQPINDSGKAIVDILQLNDGETVKQRFRWIRMLRAIQRQDPQLFRELMSYPDNLPDLRTNRAPRNLRPSSAQNCYFVLRQKDELPAVY